MSTRDDLAEMLCRVREQPSAEKATAFRAHLDRVRGEGIDTPYVLPYPKWEFLTYLADHEGCVFHGSNKVDLEVLEPIRESTDVSEFGKQELVFAAPDPLLAMWFAILDKEASGGTGNGAFPIGQFFGPGFVLYWFAIDHTRIEAKPYQDGMLYVLDGGLFKEREIGQWGSREPVKPFLRIPVSPVDFPYLDHVKGADFAALDTRIGGNPLDLSWFRDREAIPHAPEIPEAIRGDMVKWPLIGVVLTAFSHLLSKVKA